MNAKPRGSAGPGSACEIDDDCRKGLECILELSNPRSGVSPLDPWAKLGPAGGYCAERCVTDERCKQSNPDSRCFYSAFCSVPCTPELPGRTQCSDRPDAVTCSPMWDGADQIRYQCLPTCANDAACGPGRYCDLGTGFCSPTTKIGNPLGTPCSGPNDSSCAGRCLDTGAGSICSGRCSVGVIGCGETESAVEPGMAFCEAYDSGELGEPGRCMIACDRDDDCASTAECHPRSNRAPVLEAAGECWPDLGSEPVTEAGSLSLEEMVRVGFPAGVTRIWSRGRGGATMALEARPGAVCLRGEIAPGGSASLVFTFSGPRPPVPRDLSQFSRLTYTASEATVGILVQSVLVGASEFHYHMPGSLLALGNGTHTVLFDDLHPLSDLTAQWDAKNVDSIEFATVGEGSYAFCLSDFVFE